jgi:hypothetical protein
MAKRFELFYSEPGAGKSRSLIEIIKQVQALGLDARVYIGDGSMVMYSLAAETGHIDGSKLHLMDFTIRDYPFTTLQQITEGYWPVDPLDPKSKMVRLTPQQVAQTGIWIYEGASVGGNYMMGDALGGLAQRAADGEQLGQDANVKFVDDPSLKGPDGQPLYKYGGNSPAHFGIAQRHLLQDILRSKALPGEWVIWTAHERIDDGERGGSFSKGQTGDKTRVGEKCIGPELIGKALTSNISRDFGNTLHFATATKKVADGQDPATGKTQYKDKTEYRVYTRDHYDPDGIVSLKYRALCRSINPELIKDYYTADKAGQAVLEFYRDLEKSNKQ